MILDVLLILKPIQIKYDLIDVTNNLIYFESFL